MAREETREAPSFGSLQEYEASLSIPREGEVPPLTEELVRRISHLVFVPSEPGPADVLFVFGTVQGDWGTMARLLITGECRRAVLAGLIGPSLYERNLPIAEEMREKLLAHGAPAEKLAVQNRSNNTLEDVEFSLDLLQGATSILFAAKAHHSGRCLLTLRRFFPDIPMHAMTIPAWYGDIQVTEENWTETQVGRARVWGEYQRILTYSERGDIARPQ